MPALSALSGGLFHDDVRQLEEVFFCLAIGCCARRVRGGGIELGPRPAARQGRRAGQEEVTRENSAAGFELVQALHPAFLSENYVLRFRKVEKKI